MQCSEIGGLNPYHPSDLYCCSSLCSASSPLPSVVLPPPPQFTAALAVPAPPSTFLPSLTACSRTSRTSLPLSRPRPPLCTPPTLTTPIGFPSSSLTCSYVLSHIKDLTYLDYRRVALADVGQAMEQHQGRE